MCAATATRWTRPPRSRRPEVGGRGGHVDRVGPSARRSDRPPGRTPRPTGASRTLTRILASVPRRLEPVRARCALVTATGGALQERPRAPPNSSSRALALRASPASRKANAASSTRRPSRRTSVRKAISSSCRARPVSPHQARSTSRAGLKCSRRSRRNARAACTNHQIGRSDDCRKPRRAVPVPPRGRSPPVTQPHTGARPLERGAASPPTARQVRRRQRMPLRHGGSGVRLEQFEQLGRVEHTAHTLVVVRSRSESHPRQPGRAPNPPHPARPHRHHRRQPSPPTTSIPDRANAPHRADGTFRRPGGTHSTRPSSASSTN